MTDKRKIFTPVDVVGNLQKFIAEIAYMIRSTDEALRKYDEMFRNADKIILGAYESELFSGKEEEAEEEVSGYTGETKSYEGQSDASYCAECLVSHYSTVYGLLDEAYRLSLNEDKLNNESLNRVKEALKELKTSLYDLGAVKTDWTDEFRREVREIRKKYLLQILADPSRKDLLKEAVDRVKRLYDRAVEILQMEKQREEKGEVGDKLEIERQIEQALTYFINKKDIQYLEKAYRLAPHSGCPACVKYLAAALDAAKEGRMDEAIEWATGVRRGIRVILYGKE